MTDTSKPNDAPPNALTKTRAQGSHLSVQMVEAALRNAGGFVSGAARLLGCDVSTVRRQIQKHPELAAIKEDAIEKLLDGAESKLMQAVKEGAPWAICFVLKCKGRQRGWIEQQDFRIQATADDADRRIADIFNREAKVIEAEATVTGEA